MNNKLEHILCAAIHYDDGQVYAFHPTNIESGYVVAGHRHHDIISTYSILTGKKTLRKNVQGFLTSANRFVDRTEAGQIAFMACQTTELHRQLFSENLY